METDDARPWREEGAGHREVQDKMREQEGDELNNWTIE